MSLADLKIELFRKLDKLNGESLKEAYGLLLNYMNSNAEINEWDDKLEIVRLFDSRHDPHQLIF